MNLEEEILGRKQVDFAKLESFGFKKEKQKYTYSKEIENHFCIIIVVDEKGNLSGKIIDLQMNDEYTAFRIEKNRGEFAGCIREEYKKLLKEIGEKCFIKNDFLFPQSNRIASYILKNYNTSPEFLWTKFPNYGVFRNKENNKWFGIIMNIEKSKIMKDKRETEILVIKVEEEQLKKLLKKKGIYEAYHMNKKNWASVLLDDTLSDTEIEAFIDTSYSLISAHQEWLIPANPKYYDIIAHFKKETTIWWHASIQINVGDIVYIYMANPYSSILYKCEVEEVSKMESTKNKGSMKLKLVKEYEEGKITFTKLKELGIKAIRGSRKIPKEISKNF